MRAGIFFNQSTRAENQNLAFFLTVKGRKMENVRNENGTCGCGRSPTGDCIGWHELTPEQYEAKTDADKEAMFGDSK